MKAGDVVRRKKQEFVGYEHPDCENCEHAIYRDELDEHGELIFEEHVVGQWEAFLYEIWMLQIMADLNRDSLILKLMNEESP